MVELRINLPSSPSSKGFYLMIIVLNAALSFRMPPSVFNLILTMFVYILLLTGKTVTKFLALLLSMIRLIMVFSYPVKVSFWTMLVTYSLSIMLCWILYKISVSVDNKQLLHIFNVKLMEPPSLYLKDLQFNCVQLLWEHPLDRYIDGYQIEVNNHIVCRCDAHERAVSIPNLRPNCTYRIRIWAYSKTRGRAPSLYISFHTPKEPVEGNQSPTYQAPEIPTEDDVKQLEQDIKIIQESRENIKTEMELLQKEESEPNPIIQDIQVKKEELEALELKVEQMKKENSDLKEEHNNLLVKKQKEDKILNELNSKIKKFKNSLTSKQNELEYQEKFKLDQPKQLQLMGNNYLQDMAKLKKEFHELKEELGKVDMEASKIVKQYDTIHSILKRKKDEADKIDKELKRESELNQKLGNITPEAINNFLEDLHELENLRQSKKELDHQLNMLSSKRLDLLQSLAHFNKLKSVSTPFISKEESNEDLRSDSTLNEQETFTTDPFNADLTCQSLNITKEYKNDLFTSVETQVTPSPNFDNWHISSLPSQPSNNSYNDIQLFKDDSWNKILPNSQAPPSVIKNSIKLTNKPPPPPGYQLKPELLNSTSMASESPWYKNLLKGDTLFPDSFKDINNQQTSSPFQMGLSASSSPFQSGLTSTPSPFQNGIGTTPFRSASPINSEHESNGSSWLKGLGFKSSNNSFLTKSTSMGYSKSLDDTTQLTSQFDVKSLIHEDKEEDEESVSDLGTEN